MRHPPNMPPLVDAFLTAHYRIFLPDGEARLLPGRPFSAKIGAPGTPWALLTAFNPGAAAVAHAANDAAQSRLLAMLHAAGHACWPGLNSDPEGGHAETSVFALGIEPVQADALADRFGQCALLAGRLGGPVVLRVLTAHWRAGIVDTPFVEWVASGGSATSRP
jgi:hypothetical protein